MNPQGLSKILTAPFLALIWVYQKVLSPMLPPSCIYHPSCSHYAQQALTRHGLLKGLLLSVWRLLRCQPFCQGGVDEVPETFNLFKPR